MVFNGIFFLKFLQRKIKLLREKLRKKEENSPKTIFLFFKKLFSLAGIES